MSCGDLLSWPERAAALDAEREAHAAWARARRRWVRAPRGLRLQREAELRRACAQALEATRARAALMEPVR